MVFCWTLSGQVSFRHSDNSLQLTQFVLPILWFSPELQEELTSSRLIETLTLQPNPVSTWYSSCSRLT